MSREFVPCAEQKQAPTCLAAMSFPRGIGAPFSVAIRFSVARAFSWFPVSTSYRALSGSHCSPPTSENRHVSQ